MIIYPAIDIKGGKCVHLLQGRANDETVFSESPVDMARRWAKLGAKYLHVVDLDGAFDGISPNLRIISEITKAISIPIQLGGGIRTMEKIMLMLDEYGVRRVILGTAAMEEPDLLQRAVQKYGNRIIVGIDAKQGKAAIKGWVQETDILAVDLGKKMKALGIDTVVYTDIAKDGMMSGPNLKESIEMIEKTGLNIIASGGISKLEDLHEVKKTGAAGAIIGRALYTGSIQLPDALMV